MPDAEDFWPAEIPDPGDSAPVALMKGQASRIGSRTKGEIEGLVRTSTEGGTAFHSLYLKADALGDHLYKLLFIAHPAIGQPGDDPVTAQSSAGGPPTTIENDAAFRGWLRPQLSSDYVRSALGSLRRYIRERRAAKVG